MRRRTLFFPVLIFGIFTGSTLGKTEKLVGLNGDSQNSRYVEIRRSPGGAKKVDDAPSFGNLPKAHGISSGVPQPNTANEVRRAPQAPQGVGFSSPFASLIPGMPSVANLFSPFPMMLPQPQMLHQPIPQPSQTQYVGYQQNAAPTIINGVQPLSGLNSPTPAPRQELPTEIQTLSATLAPMMTLPTLPTLIPIPTFPPFTLPPSFDKMAAGYTKKKRRRKLRRKAPKVSSEKIRTEESQLDESDFRPEKHSHKTLPRVESRLPKYAVNPDSSVPSKKAESWMVPYYTDGKENKKE